MIERDGVYEDLNLDEDMFDTVQNTMLIVDDLDISREVLSLYFEKSFMIMEAIDGKEALEILKVCNGFIDIILLDLSMPKMDGQEFLDVRKDDPALLEIPVIVITASQAAQDELEAFELGIDDYITKPFLPEIVDHRVQKVLSNRRNYKEVLMEKKDYQIKSEIDLMTGLYNKVTTENSIEDILRKFQDQLHALMVIDIDKFKKVNDVEGHLVGDQVIAEVASVISQQFRKSDIVGRIGGDEFSVLLLNIPSEEVARKHARNLLRIIKYKVNLKMPSYVTLSIGIAYNNRRGMSYCEIFEKADQALYYAKHNGKNQYWEFGQKKEAHINMDDVILVYNSSRSICICIEEVLNGKGIIQEVCSINDFTKALDDFKEKVQFIFVDVSDEIDEGTYIWKNLEKIKNEITIPMIAIVEEGNLQQYKKAIEADVKAVVENPIEHGYLKRRLEHLSN